MCRRIMVSCREKKHDQGKRRERERERESTAPSFTDGAARRQRTPSKDISQQRPLQWLPHQTRPLSPRTGTNELPGASGPQRVLTPSTERAPVGAVPGAVLGAVQACQSAVGAVDALWMLPVGARPTPRGPLAEWRGGPRRFR